MSGKPSEPSDHELLTAIVNEVDEAHDVFELARQLAHALPLRSFEDVTKAVGPRGTINFRGSSHIVANFVGAVPEVLFPIDSVAKLVTLLAATVRLAPANLHRADENSARIRTPAAWHTGGAGNDRRSWQAAPGGPGSAGRTSACHGNPEPLDQGGNDGH